MGFEEFFIIHKISITYPAGEPVSGPVWLLAGVSGPRVVSIVPGTMTLPLPSDKWVNT